MVSEFKKIQIPLQQPSAQAQHGSLFGYCIKGIGKMHVLDILSQRKNRISATPNAASPPSAADAQSSTRPGGEDEDDIVILEKDQAPLRKPSFNGGDKKTLPAGPASASKSAKKAPAPASAKKSAAGAIDCFFTKKSGEDRVSVEHKKDEEGAASAPSKPVQSQDVDVEEVEKDQTEIVGSTEVTATKEETVELKEAEEAKAPMASAQTSGTSAVEGTKSEPSPSENSTSNALASSSSTATAPSAGSKRELAPEDLRILKDQVRSAGVKSKEALIKEIHALIPHASERQVSIKVNELGLKLKWQGEKAKTWKLKEDLSAEELENALAAENEKKASDAEKRAAKKEQPKSSTAASTGAPSADAPATQIDVPEEIEIVEVKPAIVEIPVVAPRPLEAPVVVKPKELDQKAKDLLADAGKVLSETKTLLREIFESVEGVRSGTAVSDLAKAVPKESFTQSEPSAEAVKLLSVVVSDSRRVDKAELVRALSQVLGETGGPAPAYPVLESWLDLVAKRVDYFDDCWGFEMERKDDKVGKSRRSGLRNTHQILKNLVKLEKDLTANKANPNYDKFQATLKDAEEKLAKARREWFNREEKKVAVPSASAPIAAAQPSNDGDVPPASSAAAKPAKGGSKKSASAKDSRPVGESAAATVPTPKPKNTLLTFFGSSSVKKTAPEATAAAAAAVPAPSDSESLLAKLNESAEAPSPVEVEFVECSPSAKRVRAVESEEIQVVEPVPSAATAKKRSIANNNVRKVYIYIDSRIRFKVYRKGSDDEAYFGRSRQVTGRRPLGKSDALDYDIDSEDEDGESLSDADLQGDEDEEDTGLDYKDGWLEHDEDLGIEPAGAANDDQQLTKLVPRIVGVCFGASAPMEMPVLSIRNQPFEPQSEDPMTYMAGFSCVVKLATVKECEDAIRGANPSAAASSSTGSPSSASPSRKTEEAAAPKKKRVPPPRPVPVEIEGATLRLVVEMVEGNISSKKNMIADIFDQLKQRFPDATPTKGQIETKLDEICERTGKQWTVKEETMKAVGLERKSLTGNLSVFEKATVLQDLKNHGKENPSVLDVAQAEQTFLRAKLLQEHQRAKAAKEANAALRAAKAAVKASTAPAASSDAAITTTEVPAGEAPVASSEEAV